MKKIFILIIFGISRAVVAFEDSGTPSLSALKEVNDVQRIVVRLGGEYIVAKNNSGGQITGPGINLSILYGINHKIGAGSSIRQGFSNSFGLLFTQIDLNIGYSLRGNMIKEGKVISIDGVDVVKYDDRHSNDYKFNLHASQYYFNRTVSISTFSGIGGSVFYDFTLQDSRNYFCGLRADRLSNGSFSIMTYQVLFGLTFGL